jgi:hypothetical protein
MMLKMQSMWRMVLASKHRSHQMRAILRIQALIRGGLARIRKRRHGQFDGLS